MEETLSRSDSFGAEDDKHSKVLLNIDEKHVDHAQRLLALLCYASQPLSVAGCIEAMAVDLKDEKVNNKHRLKDADDLQKICPGLVKVDKDMKGILIVKNSHPSIREYLESDRVKPQRAARFVSSSVDRHVETAKVCLVYLLSTLPSTQPRTSPFIRYAASSWMQHYDQATGKTSQLESLITRLFEDPPRFNAWMRIYDEQHSQNGASAPLYYASLLGLTWLVRKYLDAEPSQTKRYILINARGGFYYTSLIAACAKGHVDVIRMLLDANADIRANGSPYGTALQAASGGGHEEVVQMLLNAGADVNARGGEADTALKAAAVKGYANIVRMLLEQGADVNVEGGEYVTALRAAAVCGHREVVQILLDAGAETRIQDPNCDRTTIEEAARLGHPEVVTMLLDAESDPEVRDQLCGKALKVAFIEGKESVAEALLSARHQTYPQLKAFTSLLLAVWTGNNKTGPRELLKAQVDDPAWPDFLLIAASRSGYEKIVKILLDEGPRYANEGLTSALQAASAGGHAGIVRMLLEVCDPIDLETLTEAEERALRKQHKEVAEILDEEISKHPSQQEDQEE